MGHGWGTVGQHIKIVFLFAGNSTTYLHTPVGMGTTIDRFRIISIHTGGRVGHLGGADWDAMRGRVGQNSGQSGTFHCAPAKLSHSTPVDIFIQYYDGTRLFWHKVKIITYIQCKLHVLHHMKIAHSLSMRNIMWVKILLTVLKNTFCMVSLFSVSTNAL